MSTDQYFDGTCERLHLGDCPDKQQELLLDPCSCKGYWQCTNTFSTIYTSCPNNTLYNYINGRCDHEKDVSFNQPCREGFNTWIRCNDTVPVERLQELKAYCTNTTTTTEGMTAAPPTSSTDPSSGVNAGMVVGLIIAGAVAAFVIIALVIMYRRRKSKLRRNASNASRTSAHNPEYFEGGVADDPYAVIDDRMTDPQYNGNSNAGYIHDLNGTMSTTTTTLPHDDSSVYDNSLALVDNRGNTGTLTRETNDEQEPYDRLATINESEANSGASANQHGGTGNSKLTNGDGTNENNNVITDSRSETGYKVPPPPIAVRVVDNESTNDDNEGLDKPNDYLTLEKYKF